MIRPAFTLSEQSNILPEMNRSYSNKSATFSLRYAYHHPILCLSPESTFIVLWRDFSQTSLIQSQYVLGRILTQMAAIIDEFFPKVTSTTALAFAVAADISIAGSLWFYLHRRKTGVPR